MRIFVDADACPKVIKEILFRAAIRTETVLILVANQYLEVPYSPFIKTQKVSAGFDVADNAIVEQIQADDLVITADIPLACAVIKQGNLALDPRGVLYTENNIQQRLSTRNLMSQLRDSGIVTGGPKSFDQRDRQAFANQLDKILRKIKHK